MSEEYRATDIHNAADERDVPELGQLDCPVNGTPEEIGSFLVNPEHLERFGF